MRRAILFLIPLLIFAQDHTFDLSAGLSLSRGNSQSTRFYGKGLLQLNRKDATFSISTRYIYGKGKEGVDTNQGNIKVTTQKIIKGNWRLLSSVSYFYDKLADIEGRVNFSVGLNYALEKDKKNKFSLSASYSEEYESHFTKVLIKRTSRFTLQMNMTQSFKSGAQLTLGALYTPSLIDIFNDFRIEGEASIKVLMKEPFWINFSLSERYNNQPPLITLKKNDIILITSLEITM